MPEVFLIEALATIYKQHILKQTYMTDLRTQSLPPRILLFILILQKPTYRYSLANSNDIYSYRTYVPDDMSARRIPP